MPQSLTRTAPVTRVFPCLTLFLKQLSDIPTVFVPVNSAFMSKVDVTNAYDRQDFSELAWEPWGAFSSWMHLPAPPGRAYFLHDLSALKDGLMLHFNCFPCSLVVRIPCRWRA